MTELVAGMPPLKHTLYLAHWLGDVGWCKSGGMGPTSVDWSDIKSWSELANPGLTRTEAQMLIMASRAYVGQYGVSRDPNAPAPYIDESKLPPGVVRRG